jgi:hypothetical protein
MNRTNSTSSQPNLLNDLGQTVADHGQQSHSTSGGWRYAGWAACWVKFPTDAEF